MGNTYEISCKKCGYAIRIIEGAGFLFPMIYQDTVKKMKKGELGEQAQVFFANHPDGAINCDMTLAQCKGCGEYFETYDWSMHLPKPEIQLPDGASDAEWQDEKSNLTEDYVMPRELDEEYDLYEKFNHPCPKCGSKAEVVDDYHEKLTKGLLKCPRCGSELEGNQGNILWD